jgi:hypothetical protein
LIILIILGEEYKLWSIYNHCINIWNGVVGYLDTFLWFTNRSYNIHRKYVTNCRLFISLQSLHGAGIA